MEDILQPTAAEASPAAMFKFAIASFLFLQVAFSAEIHEGTSFNLEGNVNSFVGDKTNSLGESSVSASAEFVADVKAASDLEDKLEDLADKMTIVAESMKNYAANALTKLAESFKGISQNAQAGSSLEPSFNAQAGASMNTQTPGKPRPFTNAQGGAANVQGSLNIGGSLGA